MTRYILAAIYYAGLAVVCLALLPLVIIDWIKQLDDRAKLRQAIADRQRVERLNRMLAAMPPRSP